MRFGACGSWFSSLAYGLCVGIFHALGRFVAGGVLCLSARDSLFRPSAGGGGAGVRVRPWLGLCRFGIPGIYYV